MASDDASESSSSMDVEMGDVDPEQLEASLRVAKHANTSLEAYVQKRERQAFGVAFSADDVTGGRNGVAVGGAAGASESPFTSSPEEHSELPTSLEAPPAGAAPLGAAPLGSPRRLAKPMPRGAPTNRNQSAPPPRTNEELELGETTAGRRREEMRMKSFLVGKAPGASPPRTARGTAI